jgi:hypothetical protein
MRVKRSRFLNENDASFSYLMLNNAKSAEIFRPSFLISGQQILTDAYRIDYFNAINS